MVRPAGVSVSGPVLERFPEYIVKFESNKPKVFGVQGNDNLEVDLPPGIPLVLGRPGWLGEMLKFPIRVGLTWSDRSNSNRPAHKLRSEEVQYEVQALEKIKTPKGEFDAFKIVMTMNAPKVLVPSPGAALNFGLTLTIMRPMSKLLLHLIRPEALVWRPRLSITVWRNKNPI